MPGRIDVYQTEEVPRAFSSDPDVWGHQVHRMKINAAFTAVADAAVGGNEEAIILLLQIGALAATLQPDNGQGTGTVGLVDCGDDDAQAP